jgi:hypothetical protein
LPAVPPTHRWQLPLRLLKRYNSLLAVAISPDTLPHLDIPAGPL